MNVLILATAIVLGSPVCESRSGLLHSSAQATAVSPATEDVESLVRQALEDRFRARNIPDIGLLGNSTKIAVRQEMPSAGARLSDKALPQVEGLQFFLITEADAQAAADRTGGPVHFVTVDRPSITDASASLAMGVDVVFARKPDVIKLCCCSGEGTFRLVNGRWSFAAWAKIVCH